MQIYLGAEREEEVIEDEDGTVILEARWHFWIAPDDAHPPQPMSLCGTRVTGEHPFGRAVHGDICHECQDRLQNLACPTCAGAGYLRGRVLCPWCEGRKVIV